MFLDFEKHVLHATLKNVGRNAAKQRGDLDAIVHINSRRTAADRIHAGQMRCGLL
jgi:hypothetical protein